MSEQPLNQIEDSFIGKWSNGWINLFFEGRLNNDIYGTFTVDIKSLGIYAKAQYEISRKSTGNTTVLRVIIEDGGKSRISEWEITQISRATGELKIKNEDSVILSFYKG